MVLAFVIALIILVPMVWRSFLGLRRLRESESPLWKKGLKITVALITFIIYGVGFWTFFIEPNRLVVRQQTIKVATWPEELSGIRIAMIGDLHAGSAFINEKKVRRVVELTNQQNPDLVVLLGDYMVPNNWHSRPVDPEVIAGILKELRAPLGVYAVLGNHDWWYAGDKVRAAFEKNGVRVLEEELAEVKWRGGSFWLIGFADIWTRPQHISETIRKAPAGVTTIGLVHNPDMFIHMPRSMPLMLAAHTHGGQIRLPLIGTPIVPSYFGPRYAAGHVFENGHHMFVTTGIGTTILPVRLRVPPEIVVLTIEH